MEDKHENKRNQNYISEGENWWGKNIQKDRKNLNKISKLRPLDIHRAYTQNSKIGLLWSTEYCWCLPTWAISHACESWWTQRPPCQQCSEPRN